MLRHYNIPKATEVHFFGPDISIETLAPILIEHKFIRVADDSAEAAVDEVASDAKAQSKPYQWNDQDPFLSWVFGCLPCMVNFTLLHPS